MESNDKKDWILLLVPILSNGILIYFFQNYIKSKLDHLSKRNSLRDETFKSFWKKLQELNDIFIQANLNAMNNPNTITEGLTTIKNAIFSLVKFYDTNKYDLKIFSKEFNKFQDSWTQFISNYNRQYIYATFINLFSFNAVADKRHSSVAF